MTLLEHQMNDFESVCLALGFESTEEAAEAQELSELENWEVSDLENENDEDLMYSCSSTGRS